jgi:NAD(P)-dependent dehydrogenase (short-subunit alcohol dehydrogenase family)
MDPEVGDLTGDVLIEDDKIVAVEPNISADAEVIDASDSIVIPGFVDTHRHTWETAVRGCAPNATLDDYFVEVLDTFAPAYRDEDVYASNLVGSLECLNAGITTLVDWSHINNTPDHSDAAITALQETGIRAQYAYGSANLSLADYWFNSSIAIPGEDVRRIKETYFNSNDGLLTMGLATRGSGFCQEEVVRAEWKLARELGIPITVHVSMGRAKDRPYPGSTTVSTVNGGVSGMVRTLSVQLAPRRVNAIHPGIVADSPYWIEKPEAAAKTREATPTGRNVMMEDIVDAVDFLIRNRAVNGTDLYVDGGWLRSELQ